jgi:hypothetical protein
MVIKCDLVEKGLSSRSSLGSVKEGMGANAKGDNG